MKAASLPFPAEAARTPARPTGGYPSVVPPAWPVALLGLPFATLTVSAAVRRIEAMVASRQPHRVSLVGIGDVLASCRLPELKRMFVTADLLLAESATLRCASWLAGNPLPREMSAARLMTELLAVAADRHWRVFVLDGAGTPPTASLTASHPEIQVVGGAAPAEIADRNLLAARIRRARPDILVGTGLSHAHRLSLAAHVPELGTPVCVDCGAPAAALGALEPRSRSPRGWIARLIEGAKAGLHLLRHHPHLTLRQRQTGNAAVVGTNPEWLDIDAGVALTRGAFDADAALWTMPPAAAASRHCTIDGAHIRHVDATGVALLACHAVALRQRQRLLVLVRPSAVLLGALSEAGLSDFFLISHAVGDAHGLAPPPGFTTIPGITRNLAWCGEIVAANADDVWQMTSEYVRTFAGAGATFVILDLSRLRQIDAAGAALMLRVKRHARDFGADVCFVHPQPRVHQLLVDGGVDQLLLEGHQ